MPRYSIERATNFIVEEESWIVVEYDHTSVPGIIYISLTENKINSIYDDVENNIADIDKLAKYDLILPPLTQIFNINETISPVYTITKNGKPYKAEVEYITTDKKIVRIISGVPTAVGAGTTTLIVRLKDYPDIQQELTITVGNEEQEFSAYIEGADTIRLDRLERYELKGTSDIIGQVNFSIDSALATIQEVINNKCVVIHANNKNKLGTITLTAEYQGNTYTKIIKIIPLW